MQVEEFAGPARSDGFGVGMVDAVYASEPVTLRLKGLAAECEVEVLGQVVVADPGLAGLPVGFTEQPTL